MLSSIHINYIANVTEANAKNVEKISEHIRGISEIIIMGEKNNDSSFE